MNDETHSPHARPVLTLIVACIATLLAFVPISHLRLSSSITESLGDGAAVKALATLEQHFPKSNNVLVLLETRDRQALQRDKAQAIRAISMSEVIA